MKYIERTSEIINDKYTEYVYEAFDIQNKEKTIVKIPINFNECKNFDWNIGVIYGGSGTGKTTLLSQFGKLADIKFDDKKPLISNFDFLEPKEATFLLSAMGLSSVPTWLRPFGVLSNGEKYRASLAYAVANSKENEVILIDEYTSVVDRDVAKAMSTALQKYIRRNNKRIILASCHFDIMEWLLPDWTYSPLKARVERHDCRRQFRPEIKLQIFRCRYETWEIFKQHHYLTGDLNKAAKCFLMTWHEKPVAFLAILPLPHKDIVKGYRISRTVVLPDYQGFGIGGKVMSYIAAIYEKEGCKMYFKTSNPALWNHGQKNKEWKLVNEMTYEKMKLESIKKMQENGQSGLSKYREAVTKSFKYVGEPSEDNTNILTFNADAWKHVAQNQISLFNDEK